MPILVTGCQGRLGQYLFNWLPFNVSQTVVGLDRAQCDITDPLSVKQTLRHIEPDVIIHCAALTDVDKCHHNVMLATHVNSQAVATIVKNMKPDAKLVYISTDQVYPGTEENHYYEEFDVGPCNAYGITKLSGEAAASINDRALILRTNFFGHTPWKPSFSDWVLEAIQSRTGEFYNDVWFTPVHIETLCTVICQALEEDLEGTFNVGSRMGMTKADFATRLGRHMVLDGRDMVICPSRFSTPRPKNTMMDVTKIECALGPMPTTMEEIEKL